MTDESLGEHKPLEALSIMLKHLGGEVHYYLHGHDGLYLTKKELLEKMKGALNE